MIDCLSCGNRLETKIGSYSKQTFLEVEPYCANPNCKNFIKKQSMIKIDCGCYIITAVPHPITHLKCEDHVGSAVYDNYDGRMGEVCDKLMRILK